MSNENTWSSKLGFILASAGAAIGLGQIWKFPYVAGMNGGGAFLLLFIVFTLLIGLPMLISEYVIGRGSGKEAVGAYDTLAPNSYWRIIGRLGVLGCFLLFSFYAVVGGWVLIYTILSLFGQIIQEGANYAQFFVYVIGTPWVALLGSFIFILINILVIASGVQNGIERASKYMMPILFLFLLILVIRAVTLDGASKGLIFFLKPDFSAITAEGFLYALGQSFFALAVGFSCMVTYASYLDRSISIPNSAGTVAIMNIFVSILAGLVIFPSLFAFGYEPTEGPGLLFIVLPAVFSEIPFGALFLSLFLILFLFAALTSAFSLLEIMVAPFVAKGYSRKKVSWIGGLLVFIAGIPAALSYGVLGTFTLFDKNIFDLTDYLVSNLLLPLGSLLIALFIGYKLKQTMIKEQFFLANPLSEGWYNIWFTLMRYIVPVTIVIVFLNTLGILGGT